MKKYETNEYHDPTMPIVPEDLFQDTDKVVYPATPDDTQAARNALSAFVVRHPELATPEELRAFVGAENDNSIDK